MQARHTVGFTLVNLALVAGCGSTFRAGFSNVPSANRQSRPQDGHDVITNGTESCGTPGTTNADPLRYRVPPCQTDDKHATSQLPSQP